MYLGMYVPAAKSPHTHNAVDWPTCVRWPQPLASLTITSRTNGRLPASQQPNIPSACYWRGTSVELRFLVNPPKLSDHYMYRTVVTICTAQWSLYVPHSGHYMYRTVVTTWTASITFNNSTFCPHSVFMCFVWISEQTAIISLYNINWLVCITETERVYCAIRTGDLYIYIYIYIYINSA